MTNQIVGSGNALQPHAPSICICLDLMPGALEKFYVVDFRHIQLTLKYSRIKQRKYQGYRWDLLKQIEYSSSGLSVVKTFTAKPKVVQGLRFVVSATFVFDANALRELVVERDWSSTCFCAHHFFWPEMDPSLDTYTFSAILYRAAAINAITTATQDQRVQLFLCD